MAGPYMGGYTPPGSYGNYGPGYGQQMYSSPVAQQLTRMENQYPQYGQTMQPQQYQQGQPMQNNMPQGNMPQQPQPTETFLTVATLDEARNYLPDMSGTRQIFAISSDPNKLVAKRFNIGDASTDFVVFAPMQEGQEQSAPEQAETAPQSAQPSDMMEDFKKQFEAMQEQHKQLQNAVMDMKEDFNAKLSSLSANDGPTESTDRPDVTADSANDAAGKPASPSRQSATAKSKQPDAPAVKEQAAK